MEKYFITDFKKIYADIILHNQKELNPDNNECIEGEEINKVKKIIQNRKEEIVQQWEQAIQKSKRSGRQ